MSLRGMGETPSPLGESSAIIAAWIIGKAATAYTTLSTTWFGARSTVTAC